MGAVPAPTRRTRISASRPAAAPPAPASRGQARPALPTPWLVAASLALGAVLLEFLLGWQPWLRALAWGATLAATFVSLIFTLYAAARTAGHRQVALLLGGGSLAALLVGLAALGTPSAETHAPPAAADLPLFAAPLLLVASLIVRLYPGALASVALRVGLDLAIGALAWVLVGLLGQPLLHLPDRPWEAALAISGGGLACAGLAVRLVHAAPARGAGAGLAAVASLVLALASCTYAARLLELPAGGFALGELLWLPASVLLALAARRTLHAPAEGDRPASEDAPPLGWAGLLLALGAFTLVAVVAGLRLWAGPSGFGAYAPAVLALAALVIARLALSAIASQRRLDRLAGSFEAELRDLNVVLGERGQPERLAELVCQRAREMFDADVVYLWQPDHSANELVAEVVVGRFSGELLNRRVPLADRAFVASRVYRTGQPEVVRGGAEARRRDGYFAVMTGARCILSVPVRRGRDVVGVLVFVNSADGDAYGETHRIRAELLASQAAAAFENARLFRDQRRQLEETQALFSFTRALSRALTTQQVAARLRDALRDRPGFRRAAVFLTDSSSLFLQPVELNGVESGPDEPWTTRGLRPSAVGVRAFSSNEPQRLVLPGDGRSEPCALLAVPLLHKDRAVGVIELETSADTPYTAEDERFVMLLANQAAFALENLFLLEEARKVQALKELDRLKSELLATVSHELRTPLSSIKGYTSTLLNYDHKFKRDEKRQFLKDIEEEADRLEELIANLMDMSRLDAGVLRIEKSLVDVGRIAAEAVHRAQARTDRHELVLEWEAEGEVEADPRRIRQVLNNLIENAIKYSLDGGTITVRGRVDRGFLVVSVSDQGAGIPARELDRIFDRFHRVEGELTRRVGGTGLGLAICKGLVEAHGGSIWAESAGPGQGSTFTFTLPLDPRAVPTRR